MEQEYYSNIEKMLFFRDEIDKKEEKGSYIQVHLKWTSTDDSTEITYPVPISLN